MRIFIAGIDGYLGWSLAQYLSARGHQVGGADNFFRRRWVREMKSWSATQIRSMADRLRAFREVFGRPLRFWHGDLRHEGLVARIFREFRPEAIVHFGECASAPYSMIDLKHAAFVQTNNLVTTFNLLFAMRKHCPDAHLVKLGTMGEYGTPNVDIPEGFFEIEYRGRRDRLPFPRQAGSWYHWSKVHGSHNIMFACKIWKLRATDVMQGVVFGTRHDGIEADERLLTRFDFDQCFGTVVNRYCAQAVIEHPLTPFGQGHQRRGFLPLRDSMQCLTLALDHPPRAGEYRVFNQFAEVYDVTELALAVQRVARDIGLTVTVRRLSNPRIELETHYYRPDHEHLASLGYRPTLDVAGEIRTMLQDLLRYRRRIETKRTVLIPDIRWDGRRQRAHFLKEAGPPGQRARSSAAPVASGR